MATKRKQATVDEKRPEEAVATLSQSQNLAYFPHPFKIGIFGQPNTGRTNCALNFIQAHSQTVPFDTIIVCHPLSNVRDYQQASYKHLSMRTAIVSPADTDCAKKTLVIVDDMFIGKLTEHDNAILGELLVRKKISVIVIQHLMSDIADENLKRLRAVTVTYGRFTTFNEKKELAAFSNFAGIKPDTIAEMGRALLKESTDCLTIDMAEDALVKCRFNLLYEIHRFVNNGETAYEIVGITNHSDFAKNLQLNGEIELLELRLGRLECEKFALLKKIEALKLQRR
jgi:hypothetical protein